MALRVVVVFEYDDILDTNGAAADDVVNFLTDVCRQLREEFDADKVWVDDVYMSREEGAE